MAHPDDDQIVSGHLDEGTVHAWLDGQLPADDAARVESHAVGCATCQARVAEARGLIAASSRILTALDGVPARVVPERRRGVQLWQVRAAAAVLIVALGTATVLHEARVSEFSLRRALTVSDSERLVAASAAVNEAEKPIVPSASPPPAAVLSKKPAFREEGRAPVVSKTTPRPAGERDEIKGSPIGGQGSETAANARGPRVESKERAPLSGVPGASSSPPSAAPAGATGGAAMQGAVPGAPAIAGGIASPAPGAPGLHLRGQVASIPARNSATASDSVAASRPPRTTVATAPPAPEGGIAAKVADGDRKNAQKPADAMSALDQSRLAGLSASACVGRTVTVASGVTDSNGQVVMATVQLEAAPSTDSRYPGFALGTMVDSGPPAGAWTPLGPDSAILTLPVQGPGASAQAGRGDADSLARDTLREQIVRRRVRCMPR
jgi:Putative zinc-finger